MTRMMRLAMVVGLLAFAVTPSIASTAASRTEKAAYTGFGELRTPLIEIYNQCSRINGESAGGSACFTPKVGERRVRVTVEDESGVDVAARLVRRGMREVNFCGATRGAVTIPQGKELVVFVKFGGCSGAASIPTQGVIVAKFSR